MQSDGSVIVNFDLTSMMEIRSWILSFGIHAEVLEPNELRTSIRDEAEKMASRYAVRDAISRQISKPLKGN